MNPLQVKASFNQEMRRFSVPSRNFEQLFENCVNLFKISFEKKSDLRLRYRDSDGDFVSFSSQEELDEACAIGANPLFIEIVWVTSKQQTGAEESSSTYLFAPPHHPFAGISVPMQEDDDEGDDQEDGEVIASSDQSCLFSGQENECGFDRAAFFSKKKELRQSKKSLKQQIYLLKVQKKQAWKEFKAQSSQNEESKLAWKTKKAELKAAKQVVLQQLLVLAEQNASLKAEKKMGKSLVAKTRNSELCANKVAKADLKNQILCLKKQLIEQKKAISSLSEAKEDGDEDVESKRKELKQTLDDLKGQILLLKQQKRLLKKTRFQAYHGHHHRGGFHHPRGAYHHGPHRGDHQGPFPFPHQDFHRGGLRGFGHHRGFDHHRGPFSFPPQGPFPFPPHGFGRADLKEKVLELKLKKQELRTKLRQLETNSPSFAEEKNDLMMKLFCVKKEMWTLKCQFKKAHKFGRKFHKKAFRHHHPHHPFGFDFPQPENVEQGRPSCF